MHWITINLDKYSDGRGDLIPLEFGVKFPDEEINFEVKRCFFVLPKYDEVRAQHAHKKVSQFIICLEGSFDLILKDGKGKEELITLNDSAQGVFMSTLVWNEMKNFSDICRIVVFADDHYDPQEYINNWDEFLAIANA